VDSTLKNIGIPGDVQRINASLAVALVKEYVRCVRPNVPMDLAVISRALQNTTLPGRCEIRTEKDIVWYCDVAHTRESIVAATEWYNSLYIFPFRRSRKAPKFSDQDTPLQPTTK
jgi:folylpolyglutamate synthase